MLLHLGDVIWSGRSGDLIDASIVVSSSWEIRSWENTTSTKFYPAFRGRIGLPALLRA